MAGRSGCPPCGDARSIRGNGTKQRRAPLGTQRGVTHQEWCRGSSKPAVFLPVPEQRTVSGDLHAIPGRVQAPVQHEQQLACWRMDRRVGRCSPVPPPDPGRHPFHDPLAGGAQTRIRRPQPQGRPLPWREAFADVVRGLPGHRIANEGADVMPHDALPKPRARRCTTCSRWTGRRSPGPGRRGRRSLVRVRPPSKAVGDGERLQSYPANRERPLTGGRPSTLPRDEKR